MQMGVVDWLVFMATAYYFLTGNLTEVNLPIDRMSKQIKGYAHITFMFPEHAVKAFNKLDGTTYKVCVCR